MNLWIEVKGVFTHFALHSILAGLFAVIILVSMILFVVKDGHDVKEN